MLHQVFSGCCASLHGSRSEGSGAAAGSNQVETQNKCMPNTISIKRLCDFRSVDSASSVGSAGSSSYGGTARARYAATNNHKKYVENKFFWFRVIRSRERSVGSGGGILVQQPSEASSTGTNNEVSPAAATTTAATTATSNGNGGGSEASASASAAASSNGGTPRRKCSFSSFSECRLLEVGLSDDDEEDKKSSNSANGATNGSGNPRERHHTFLFSIEAPSPPPSPPPSLKGSYDQAMPFQIM